MTVFIETRELTREFRVTDREPGVTSAFRSVLRRKYRTITAVQDISFTVGSGQVVGFLGPNGSGKTTTLKCLSGLLTPTSGTVRVLGYEPARRETPFLRRIGFVMGQRWQLHVDLPVRESFELHRVVYDLDTAQFLDSRDELIDLLDLGSFVDQQARKLSLGQRMRCEFAAALLHRPDVVLLDEPTLGLDFDAQAQIRRFVGRYVQLTGAAVLLTSHYLADIEAMCPTVMTISAGRITYQGSLQQLKALAGDRKRIRVLSQTPLPRALLAELGTVISQDSQSAVIEIPRSAAGTAVAVLSELAVVTDVSLTDPPLEETLSELYGAAS